MSLKYKPACLTISARLFKARSETYLNSEMRIAGSDGPAARAQPLRRLAVSLHGHGFQGGQGAGVDLDAGDAPNLKTLNLKPNRIKQLNPDHMSR